MTGPLRVTLVVGVFPALSETFVLDQIVSLLGMGHDVRIVAGARRADPAMHEDVAEHRLLDRTSSLDVPAKRLDRAVLILRAGRRLGPRLFGTLASFCLARRADRETGNLAAVAAMAMALAEAPRPDVVLCHFGPNASIAARALQALGWSVPLVASFHGYDITSVIHERGPRTYRHLFRRGALFLPACDAFAERLDTIGCPQQRIAVQRMCVGIEALDALVASLPERPRRQDAFVLATVGRLVEKKGIAHVIRALGLADRSRPGGFRLLVVGDGPLREELGRIAVEVGVAPLVEFLGALPRRAVLSVVRDADALVQASVTARSGDMEASPVVISEAMCLGRPVLGTRHSGLPDLIVDAVTGYLVNERDETALADAMVRLAADPDGAARMGRAGRARLEEGFSAVVWNRLLEHRLREVAAGAAASAGTDDHARTVARSSWSRPLGQNPSMAKRKTSSNVGRNP